MDDRIRDLTLKALLDQGRLADGATTIDDATAINAGAFSIDSLGLIRAFISLEDDLGVEFGDESLMQNRFSTFGDVLDYVRAELARQGV